MVVMSDVIEKEKLQNSKIDNCYRFGAYMYTCGMILLKNGKNLLAKQYLTKSESFWKPILSKEDPALNSLYSLIKACETKKY
jgi:hypothetical protein